MWLFDAGGRPMNDPFVDPPVYPCNDSQLSYELPDASASRSLRRLTTSPAGLGAVSIWALQQTSGRWTTVPSCFSSGWEDRPAIRQTIDKVLTGLSASSSALISESKSK
ncbi:MAG: hypothetical protein ABMA25_18235 [Ilumatobacteraceae bacterium]